MQKKYKGPFFGDLYRNYETRGLSHYLDDYCEDMPFIAEILSGEQNSNDIKELMQMKNHEVHAFFGLVANMNMLENLGMENEYYPDKIEWLKINKFWVDKFPSSYILLEEWVWG